MESLTYCMQFVSQFIYFKYPSQETSYLKKVWFLGFLEEEEEED